MANNNNNNDDNDNNGRSPEPPPMAEHHPGEFRFALRTLHKLAIDSELFPERAELQEWFQPTNFKMERDKADGTGTRAAPVVTVVEPRWIPNPAWVPWEGEEEEDPAKSSSALLGVLGKSKSSSNNTSRPVESITFARGLLADDDLKRKQEQEPNDDDDDVSASSSLTDFEPPAAVANNASSSAYYSSPMMAATTHASILAGLILDRQQRNNKKKVFTSLDSDDGDSLAEDLAYIEKRREELRRQEEATTRGKQWKKEADEDNDGIAMMMMAAPTANNNGPQQQRNNDKVSSAFEFDDGDGDGLLAGRGLAHNVEAHKQEGKEAYDNAIALALARIKQKNDDARKQQMEEAEEARKRKEQEVAEARKQKGQEVAIRKQQSSKPSSPVAAADDDAHRRRSSADMDAIESIDLPSDPTDDAAADAAKPLRSGGRATSVDDNSLLPNGGAGAAATTTTGGGAAARTMLPHKRGALTFEYRSPGYDAAAAAAGIEEATSVTTKDGSSEEDDDDDDDDAAYREFKELCCRDDNKEEEKKSEGDDDCGSDDSNSNDSDKVIRRLARNKEEAKEATWKYGPVPSVHERDIDFGEVLGKGGFSEVRLADLKEDRKSKRNNCGNKKKHRYAMKYLAPGIGEDRICPASGRNKLFERGIADLAIEARFLALLSHENIIGLHYVGGGGSLGAQYNTEGNDDDGGDYYRHQFGFFLLLDPLYESLAKRIKDTYVPGVFGAIGRARSDGSGGRGRSSFSRTSSLRSSLVGRIMRRETSRRAVRPPSGGDLLLDEWRTQLVERLEVLRGVASALRYLHEDCNVIYRDVKPDNIGFQRVPHVRCHCGGGNPRQPSSRLHGIKLDNGGGGGICTCYDEVPKLFDFGLAKELKPRHKQIHPHHCDGRGYMDTFKLTAKSGSRRYMAPEVAFATPYNDRADVYSFGIMLYQVSSLVTPFEGYSQYRHEDEILNSGERLDLKIPATRKALSKAKRFGGGGGGGGCPHAEWLANPDGKKRSKRLSKLTKCVWTKDLQQLIDLCWQDDMRLRPSMADVERRLGGCIQELMAAAIPKEGIQSTMGTARTLRSLMTRDSDDLHA